MLPALAHAHHVCAYDRPGTLRYRDGLPLTDRSAAVAQPRSVRSLVAELHALLAAGAVPGPYLLVGHSLGGLVSLGFGRAYPKDTAGIVFVDALSPDLRRLLGTSGRFTAPSSTPRKAPSRSPPSATPPPRPSISTPASTAIEALPPLRPMPLAVLTKTEPFRLPSGAVPAGITGPEIDAAYTAAQQFFVRQSPDTPQIFATGSEHYIQLSQPDLVVQAAVLVLRPHPRGETLAPAHPRRRPRPSRRPRAPASTSPSASGALLARIQAAPWGRCW